jgi:hypothetical protein
MRPRKIPATTGADIFSWVVTSGRLYARTTAPMATGMCSTSPPLALEISSGVIGASVPPKSMVISWSWRMPAPEPFDW